MTADLSTVLADMRARSLNVVVSPFLPTCPTFQEDIVRQVRHGLADVLAWLGEDVGPKPGDATHAYRVVDGPHRGSLVCSREFARTLTEHLAPEEGR